jgi:hypothetical protein
MRLDGSLIAMNRGSSFGLTNGGAGGMIYTYLGAILGFSAVVLSMAEMASMCVFSEFYKQKMVVTDWSIG